jgi:hypothetical protein
MQFIGDKYLIFFREVLVEIANFQRLLDEIINHGAFAESQALIETYNKLFLDDLIKEHILYEIDFVSKSIHSLGRHNPVDERTGNRHITLELKSYAAKWTDQIYDNRLSDLLKFFKYLFATIENYSIYKNQQKLEKFQYLTLRLHHDLAEFIEASELANKLQPIKLAEFHNREKEVAQKLKNGEERKSAWQMYLSLINEKKITGLYHFTAKKNLDSIQHHGALFSWSYCEKERMEVKYSSKEWSRQRDKAKGAENYVRLSFTPYYPMRYTISKDEINQEFVILEFDPAVLFRTGTLFSDRNAACFDAEITDSLDYIRNDIFGKIDDDFFHRQNYMSFAKDDFRKRLYQAEVLVFEKLPLNYLTKITHIP